MEVGRQATPTIAQTASTEVWRHRQHQVAIASTRDRDFCRQRRFVVRRMTVRGAARVSWWDDSGGSWRGGGRWWRGGGGRYSKMERVSWCGEQRRKQMISR